MIATVGNPTNRSRGSDSIVLIQAGAFYTVCYRLCSSWINHSYDHPVSDLISAYRNEHSPRGFVLVYVDCKTGCYISLIYYQINKQAQNERVNIMQPSKAIKCSWL